MPLDPQAKAFLDALYAIPTQPYHTLGAEVARQVHNQTPAAWKPEWVSLAKVENRVIDHNGLSVPIRVYTPVMSDKYLPALLFYHGGGMVIGNLDSYDHLCRQLSHQSACIVVSVDYRLAPENKFPAAVDDAYAVYAWLMANGRDIGVDPTTVALGGDSAGGNLAAVTAILARDNHLPRAQCQVLIYPATAPHADSESQHQFAEGYFLQRPTILWFHESYIRSDDDRQDFRYAPLIADDLSGLPPALVIVAGYDPLRDEGVAYAERLAAAGVSVELKEYPGMFHPFVSLAGLLDQGKEAIKLAAMTLTRYLQPSTQRQK